MIMATAMNIITSNKIIFEYFIWDITSFDGKIPARIYLLLQKHRRAYLRREKNQPLSILIWHTCFPILFTLCPTAFT